MKKLHDFIEQISDDFHSTFTPTNEGHLMNMMSEKDFPEITHIIKKYMGENIEVKFHKTGMLGASPYDVHIVEVVPND